MAPNRRTFLQGALSALALAGNACSSATSGAPEGNPADAAALSLDDFVKAKLVEAKLPGLSAAVVKGGKVVLLRHYGVADVPSSRAITDDTAFFLASLSKTATGVGAMKLVDEGKLALDEDVERYLPFKVRNPKFADQKITTRHLMTHTSSIQEKGVKLVSLSKPGDPTMSLQELLEPYLVPGGATYVEGESYAAQAPGGPFLYSNFGAALVGLVIERIAGKPFAKYMRDDVFLPFGMARTSFLLADFAPGTVATPHTFVTGQGQAAEPQSSVPYLPATALRTPAKELATFLLAMANGGESFGKRLLSEASAREMTRVQVPAKAIGNDIDGQGLLWEHRPVPGGHGGGHGGSYYGTSTRMHVRADGVGVILLSNGDVHLRLSGTRAEELAAFQEIEKRLYDDAAQMS